MSDVTTSGSFVAPNNSNYTIKNKDLEIIVSNINNKLEYTVTILENADPTILYVNILPQIGQLFADTTKYYGSQELKDGIITMIATDTIPTNTTTATIDTPPEEIIQNKIKIIITLKDTTEISNSIYAILSKELTGVAVIPTDIPKPKSKKISGFVIFIIILFAIIILGGFIVFIVEYIENYKHTPQLLEEPEAIKYLLTNTPTF